MTMATMGRLMKNFDMVSCSLRRRGGRHVRLGHDRNAFLANSGSQQRQLLDLQNALDHYFLARLQSLGDDPVRADALAHLDRTKHRLVLGR